MHVDGTLGGGSGSSDKCSFEEIKAQIAEAEKLSLDGVWAAELCRDPFLPLMAAAGQSRSVRLGTGIAVAFARNPLSVATVANDLHTYSRGRFMLGLGTQVRAHIAHRFAMPWSSPAARMREFVLAMRAIWACWNNGDRLDFRGDFYQHTLMTPMFKPSPNPFGTPPVFIAAVGPRMTEVAAEVADGMLVHPLTSSRYLRTITLPHIEGGLASSGRSRRQFTISFPGLIATGRDESEVAISASSARMRVAFYAATPAYRGVLDLHGWGDLHIELHRLSRLGQWDEMSSLIDDDVLHQFVVVGSPMECAREIQRRFGGIVDRFTVSTFPMSIDTRRSLILALRTELS